MSGLRGTVVAVEVTQSFRYRLDPSPDQEQVLASHVGASRFMYNHLLARVRENWAQVRAEKEASGDGTHETGYVSTSHFGLLYLWADIRDEVAPWWGENSAQAYNDAVQKLAKAFANFRAGRAKFPRPKRKQYAGSVKFSGTSFRLVGRHHVRLARVGDVKTYESMRKLARRYDVIVVEDLAVKNMARSKHLAKAIHDASWGELRRQLEYKAAWYGTTIVTADRFYPSSKTCSGCGAVKAKLSLNEREYHCATCGATLNRDLNAAINLARLGDPSWTTQEETRTAGTRSVAGRGGHGKTTPGPASAGPGAARASETSTVCHT